MWGRLDPFSVLHIPVYVSKWPPPIFHLFKLEPAWHFFNLPLLHVRTTYNWLPWFRRGGTPGFYGPSKLQPSSVFKKLNPGVELHCITSRWIKFAVGLLKAYQSHSATTFDQKGVHGFALLSPLRGFSCRYDHYPRAGALGYYLSSLRDYKWPSSAPTPLQKVKHEVAKGTKGIQKALFFAFFVPSCLESLF